MSDIVPAYHLKRLVALGNSLGGIEEDDIIWAAAEIAKWREENERLRRENVELNAELTMLRMENATLRRTLDLKPMRSNLGPGET